MLTVLSHKSVFDALAKGESTTAVRGWPQADNITSQIITNI